MRAVGPTTAETFVKHGIETHHEVYENVGPTLVLIPPSPITHSRIYKSQIPFPSRHLVEPDSTKQFEDAVEWALGTTREILADSEEAQEIDPPRERFHDQGHSLNLPVLVIHGDRDVCQLFQGGEGQPGHQAVCRHPPRKEQR